MIVFQLPLGILVQRLARFSLHGGRGGHRAETCLALRMPVGSRLVMFWEAAPPFYRKVALNGRPVCDVEPNRQKRTDAEAESTNVDALTLQMRHQTTDVYVPLVGSDFALSVRRNSYAATWPNAGGLSASQRPDLPFGNCWLSGVAANAHIIDRGESQPVLVEITDEQGTVHAFVELFQQGRGTGYYPLPNVVSDQDGRVMTLLRRENQLEFRRKFGVTLLFDCHQPAVEIIVAGTKEVHRYYRLNRARHNRGGYLQFHFQPDNTGLIPDEIGFAQKRMKLFRNALGQVECIVNPRGTERRYDYRPATIPGGAALLIRAQQPIIQGRASHTAYDYFEDAQKDRGHAALRLIADPLGHTYHFRYASGEDSWSALRLKEVDLPGKIATTTFTAYGNCEKRMTFVSDAEKNGVLYEFSGRETATLSGLPWRRADGGGDIVLGGWLRQEITYFQGSRHHYDEAAGKVRPHLLTRRLLRERYEFDPAAGFALAKAFDAEGKVTTFAYTDPLLRPHLQTVLPQGFVDPFSRFCRDVTESVNPLGGVRRLYFHPTNRVIVRREDELGHITAWAVDDATGYDFSRSEFANAADERANKPYHRTEWEFAHPDFPGFVTRKIVRKTGSEPDSPAWEVDLVRTYEADENGNVVRETAGPPGARLVWLYRYDENNNKLSTFFPDEFYNQFRYDPLNRLVRAYRAHQAVKKYGYDARGNRLLELEPNGDLTTKVYDGLARVTRTTVEKGKTDQRTATVTAWRYNAVNSKIHEEITGQPEKTYRFDGLQRVTAIIVGPRNRCRTTHYAYSANGCSNLFRKSLYKCASYYVNYLHKHFFTYDGLQNNLSQVRAPFRWCARLLRPQIVLRYDVAGNKVEQREGRKITTYEYNPLHELVLTRESTGKWKRILRTSTGLEYGTLDSDGKRQEKRFDSAGYEVTS